MAANIAKAAGVGAEGVAPRVIPDRHTLKSDFPSPRVRRFIGAGCQFIRAHGSPSAGKHKNF
jgi:hypothetical protein